MTSLIAIIIVIPILIIYSSFAWGYVASIIVNWFIIPIFPEAPNLSWTELAGIMFFINCFVHNSTVNYLKDEIKDNTQGVVSSLINPWLLLLCAWIFKIILY